MKNPVMFVVEVGSVLTTVLLIRNIMQERPSASNCKSPCGSGSPCSSPTSPRRWPRGAARRRPTRCAERRRKPSGAGFCRTDDRRRARATAARDDVVMVSAGEFIPGDGEVIEGVASVDESAITGESAPVIREAGGDRSAVTGGTRVLGLDQNPHHVESGRDVH